MNETAAAGPETNTEQGSRSLGNLQVSWQAWRSPLSGWHVECVLHLCPAGLPPPDAASTVLELSEDNPSQDFDLHDEVESAWGMVKLSANAHGNTLLSIDYHTGSLVERGETLCTWRVCRACDHVPPARGSALLGHGNWLRVSWTVTGSIDACQKIVLDLETADGARIATQTLTPQQPEWEQVIRHGSGYAELKFIERFRADGRITLDTHSRHAQSPNLHVKLAVLAGDIPGPGPGPEPLPQPGPGDRAGNGLVLGPPRTFASFTYPRALQPPSPNQQARRFFELSNNGQFQTQLAALQAKPDRAGMVAQAQDFVAPNSTSYPGQFVARIASLEGAFGRLHGPAVRAFLALHPATAGELNTALETLLGEPVATFLQDPNYAGELARLQDSLIALLVLGTRLGRHEAALIRALMVCHVATWLNAQTQIPPGSPAPTPTPLPLPQSTPGHMCEALQANSLLPANIFPLPQSPAASTVNPLGYADIKVIRQRLKRYRLGELAHVENVMRGETKEEKQQHRRQTELQQNDSQASHDSDQRKLDYDGRSHQSEVAANNPINDLKREFDSLKKEYGSDGLSMTVSGGWTDTVDSPATLDDHATLYARSLLDRAASRMARRISSVRRQRTLEEFSEQKIRRFQNETGSGHLIGLYHWIDEVHVAHIDHVGSRLILECNLSNPAAAFLQRSNALHGINLDVPVPPWEAANGVGAVTSANDITRANYLGLAGLYGAEVKPPPPQQRIVNTNLSSDPPHPIAQLAVPEGYLAASANVAYAWVTPPSASSQSGSSSASGQGATPTLDVLLGAAALKIDPSSAPNPGSQIIAALQATDGAVPASVVATGLSYAVNVGLVCQCPDDSPLFRQWQIDTYAEIMVAYRQRKEETNRVMGRLAEEFLRPGSEGRRETEREELCHGAIQALIAPFLALDSSVAPPPLTPDQVEFDLIPFFRQAVEWPEMSFSYFGRYPSGTSKDWLNMAQTVGQDDGFHEFLQAGSAKLLLPVGPGYILPMLFYLAANGFFWFGEPDLCPVFENDLWLANEWKSLQHRPIPLGPKESWEIEVATSMLMLRQDGALPSFGTGQSDDTSRVNNDVQ